MGLILEPLAGVRRVHRTPLYLQVEFLLHAWQSHCDVYSFRPCEYFRFACCFQHPRMHRSQAVALHSLWLRLGGES